MHTHAGDTAAEESRLMLMEEGRIGLYGVRYMYYNIIFMCDYQPM